MAGVVTDKHPAKHLEETASRAFNPWTSHSAGSQSPAPPYSAMGASPPAPHPRNALDIPPAVQARLEGIFHENCGGKPYLTAIEAAAVFMQTGLTKADLSRIWEQADLNQDGRFNLNEFVHAMWLIELPNGKGPSIDATSAPSVVVSKRNESLSIAAAHIKPHRRSSAISSNIPEAMKMKRAMICAGCEAGILPDDIIYHCAECDKKHNGLSYCERCHSAGRAGSCTHGLKRVKLEEDDLPIRDKDGSWLMGVKCIKCKTKMKKKDLCFKCSHCWDPDFCPSCWRSKDKRCKHAAKGKVKMCRVGRKDDDEIEEIIDGVMSVLGVEGLCREFKPHHSILE
ncbi:hypothetical protein ACCO45_013808 [Purpureocillium lilacinum]|uniref:Uncharacterized protein n=1 Tax=Purpureocillium lilacinum TaxID=33203 RepID=A0ACC4D9A0_PURLI